VKQKKAAVWFNSRKDRHRTFLNGQFFECSGLRVRRFCLLACQTGWKAFFDGVVWGFMLAL
jgi:hypothetical protein